ncbi:SPASM domain-containing protein [bacterium]|nr:SPASM domain-containing protein [bacterium]
MDIALARESANLSDVKAENLRLLAEDRAAGRAEFVGNPEIIVVEPTNRCNLECRICARNYWDQDANPLEDMSLETLDRLAPFFETARVIYAFGHGEPTMGENFKTILETGKRFGCEVQFTTNGTRLDDAFADWLIEAKIDIINVSMDAVESRALKDRRGIDASKALMWLQRLRVKKVAAGHKMPETGISFVADRYNLGELPHLIRGMHDVGASILVVNHLVAWIPALHSHSCYHDIDAARRAFDEAKELGESLGMTIILPYDNLRPGGGCPHMDSMFFVRASGEVWPCCSAVFRQDRYSFPAGNVYKQSLRDIWNGPMYRHIREGWAAGSPPEFCRTCPLVADVLESHLRVLG